MQKNECRCKDILLFEPFKNKPRTKERRTTWKLIADNLNQMISENFRVNQRAIRERFGILSARVEAKTR